MNLVEPLEPLEPLERMRSMRTDGKLNLKQELIRQRSDRPVGVSVLAPHLAELARPVRQDRRPPAVAQLRVGRTIRSVEPDAGEPAPRELILRRRVEAAAVLHAVQLFAAAPDDFGAAD